MRILSNFFKTILSYKLVWLLVISSVLLSISGTRYELLTSGNLADHPFFKIFFTPFNNIRYGHFIVRKFFLVIIAFLVLGFWLKTQKTLLLQIRNNTKYIFFIGLSLLVSRILTFGFWFYNDDTRFFHYQLYAPTQPNFNLQGVWGPIGSHPIALFLLVIRWFGTNYSLYNVLGLFFSFLAGIMIFALANKIQNNKFVSLIAVIFFLTTPTYFQGRLLIGEVMNSPFVLLLVLLSIYLLLQKFIPGALIFAAAALEYGIAKTYFIALPFTLFVMFFTNTGSVISRVINKKRGLIFFVTAIWLISLVYIPAFARASAAGSIGKILTLDHLLVYGDVLLAVTLPHGLSYPLVKLLSIALNNWIYITAALGFLIVACLTAVSIISFLSGKTLTVKLTLIGLSIILPCAAIASFMGVRVDRNVQKLVEYHNNSSLPMGSTGYGFFPALGLTLILIGLGYLMRKRVFKILAISLILVNIVTSILFDYEWLQSPYSFPQRRYNEQLQKILPRDGTHKYIYVPSKQRPLYQGIITFGDIFQGDQNNYLSMDPEEFATIVKKQQPPIKDIYFLITSGKREYIIYNYSDKIRSVSYDRLFPLLQSLTKELTPNPTYF